MPVLASTNFYPARSLSARRAWIEICGRVWEEYPEKVALRKESVDRNIFVTSCPVGCFLVALRKESVDRNLHSGQSRAFALPSLSARRAWIEISLKPGSVWHKKVALRKESVDRNIGNAYFIFVSVRRSPQGERG